MSESNEFFDDVIGDGSESDGAEMIIGEGGAVPTFVRTAIMAKGDMLALLGLKTSPQGGLIVRVDPRQATPAAQTYEDSLSAIKWFKRSLATSKRNGWGVVYDGPPVFG